MKWLSDAAVGHLREVADWPDLSATKYRVVEPLARGGMGTVYVAEDTELGREVALKVVSLPDLDPQAVVRMRNEARILARLEHPGIVPVHDLGMLPDGRVFYVMKLVRGSRLDEYARQEPAIPPLLRLFERICEAVAFAHAHGVIHRDLKPENVMVGLFGEVLLLDWGVARWSAGASEPESAEPVAGGGPPRIHAGEKHAEKAPGTAVGTILGTPGYMAPEQARGAIDAIDARTDVYALGAMLYFLLKGEPPPGAESVSADLQPASPAPSRRGVDSERTAAVPSHPTDPGSSSPRPHGVPRALEAIARKAMSHDPAGRYAGAREMADDVSRYLSGLPVRALPESLFDRGRRLVGHHKTPILLVLAYLLMRTLLLLFQARGR